MTKQSIITRYSYPMKSLEYIILLSLPFWIAVIIIGYLYPKELISSFKHDIWVILGFLTGYEIIPWIAWKLSGGYSTYETREVWY